MVHDGFDAIGRVGRKPTGAGPRWPPGDLWRHRWLAPVAHGCPAVDQTLAVDDSLRPTGLLAGWLGMLLRLTGLADW